MLFTLCVDTTCGLGRLDYASLSQQALMEMVIENLTDKENICGSTDAPSDLNNWKGLTLNNNGDVQMVHWRHQEGSFHLEWLPSTVQHLYLAENETSGTVDASKLPSSMLYVNFYANPFFGSFEFSQLPENLETLYISSAKFDGSVDLTRLPKGMKYLFIDRTPFSGTVDLTQLPESLDSLALTETYLNGPIDLTKLPSKLRSFSIFNSDFSGNTDFSKLPESLEHFSVEGTELSGDIMCEYYTRKYHTEETQVRVFVRLNGDIQKRSGLTLIVDGHNPANPIYVQRHTLEEQMGHPY